MKKQIHHFILISLTISNLFMLTACGGFKSGDGVSTFQAKATAYYPSSDAVEGGFVDRKGNHLYTVQDYLRGDAPYISVAMDSTAFPYGTKIRIPEIEQVYGRQLEFRVVDTGGDFRGKGTTRIDICVESKTESYKKHYNTYVTIIVL